MEDLNSNDLSCLPFYNLNDKDLRALNGSWFHDIDFSKELYNLVPNPDKFDDADPDLALTTPVSDHYTIPQINKFIDINKQNDLFLYHCNIYKESSKELVTLE
jgi:hypothetical protein